MSPDDFDSLPPDDPFHTEDAGDLDPADGLAAGEETVASQADDYGGEGGAELGILFGAGGALELPTDPTGDRELARWLDEPAPPGRAEELTDFAERLARRLRGD